MKTMKTTPSMSGGSNSTTKKALVKLKAARKAPEGYCMSPQRILSSPSKKGQKARQGAQWDQIAKIRQKFVKLIDLTGACNCLTHFENKANEMTLTRNLYMNLLKEIRKL
jgi:hypothetical protein